MKMSTELKKGSKAPDFSGVCDSDKSIKLSSFNGKNVILYFYPKDDTPGCTKESCEFRSANDDFLEHETIILGVSKDSVARHNKFKEKYNLPFLLVSDESGKICEAYGVWREKKNYGKTYMGIERSTFLIDKKGVIQKVWRKVRVNGHVNAVMDEVTQL